MKEVQNVVHVAISHCSLLLSDRYTILRDDVNTSFVPPEQSLLHSAFVPKYEVDQIDSQMFQNPYVSYSSKKAT